MMALCTHMLRACRVTVPPRSSLLITKEISLRTEESLAILTFALKFSGSLAAALAASIEWAAGASTVCWVASLASVVVEAGSAGDEGAA
eukprot:CAMPEP_0185577640 /NCGR_PEP_ID=MMETSP0434-20130131/10589_1 /TAXON_ID=626734 ORGANISM="Favella taraikaensis, Strain Fe Narragansett Bay" /NCGR_SAMPLE_ID=MMETSP0434 /ASSEMBLY_ACC=CAM_ASM_000379 /LENGTH=88 /DNA_ID=CAMNT_0028195263 /DNA_START=1297 /DNA_END=1563 /DNA_ORIENTATION=-